MKTTAKKPAVKKAVKATSTKKVEPKKAEPKKTAKSEVKKIREQLNVLSELSKIGDAYTAAINGKMKFSEVKEMFRKLHKEVKKSSSKK